VRPGQLAQPVQRVQLVLKVPLDLLDLKALQVPLDLKDQPGHQV
jgi:hypothetical protein